MKKIFQIIFLILFPLFFSGNVFAGQYYPSAVTLTPPAGSGCVGQPVNFNYSYNNCLVGGAPCNVTTSTITLYRSLLNQTTGGTFVTSVSSTPACGLGPVTGSIPYTPVDAGTYYYYVEMTWAPYTGSGCGSAKVINPSAQAFTVNEVPISLSGNTGYCPGGNLSITANAPAATSFSWTKPASATGINGLATATISKTGIVAADAGVYTLTVTGLGCTNTANVTVDVSNGIISATMIASPSTILYGGSSQLSAVLSGAAQPLSYTWRDDNNNVISTSPTPTVSPAVTSTYHMHVSDACGASTDGSVIVTVVPAGTQCNGGAIIFKESMGNTSGTTLIPIDSYTGWTNGKGLIFSGTAVVSNPSVTSTNPIIAQPDPYGSGTAFIHTNQGFPTKSFNISAINTSAYTNIVLYADMYTAGDGTGLIVTMSDGTTTNTLTINSVNGVAATTITGPTGWYRVTYGGTYISGPSVSLNFDGNYHAMDEITLKGDLKNPTGAAASASPVCEGGNVTLTASGVAPGYRWYNSSTASNASFVSANNPYTRSVAPGTNTYYVVATDGTCESSGKSSVSVTSIALPSAPTAGNQTACQGGVIPNITGTIAGAVIDWYAAATGGSVLSGGSGTSSFATGQTSQGTYTYYAESRNTVTGCMSATRTPVTLTIYAPSAIAGGPDNVCSSASPFPITLSGASVGGGATTGAWSITSGGGTLSSTLQTASPSSVTYTPAANFSGTVTLTLTPNAVGGCAPATATRTINVSAIVAPPAPGITVVNGCNSSTLTATGYTGSLLWSTGETTPSINVTAAGTYTVTQTVGACPSAPGSGTAAPQIVPAPVVTVVNKFNGTSDLTASGYTGALLWSNAQTTATINVAVAGTYTVTQTVGGCTSPPGSGVAAPSSSSGISGVINIYTKVTSVFAGTCSLTVASTAGLAVGDKVLIIQMKGDPGTIATNDPGYGTITGIGQAGNYEFAVIATLPGANVVVFNGILRSYNTSGNNAVQLVRVPKYGQATISGTLTAQPWNGTTGGVLAFEASYVIMNANITADTLGFKGGKDRGGSGVCVDNSYSYSATGSAAERGEGIASTGASYGWGKGPLANAGGGGGIHNGGGGGGANAGSGGKGGYTYCGSDLTQAQGFGGYSLSSYFGANKIFMGGGAGCGEANNGSSTIGAPGGGIIIIKADSISNGGAFKITANGRDNNYTPLTGGDGAGGGGGGGTILLDIGKYKNTVTSEVKGGKGGDNAATESTKCYAPGGGGGGGLIWYKQSSRPAQITQNVTAGNPGVQTNPNNPSCMQSDISFGAKSGSVGLERFNLAIPLSTSCVPPLPVSLLYFSATLENDRTLLQWACASEKNNDYFQVERSADALNWEAISRVQGSGNSSSVTNYSLYDPKPMKGTNYYRLKQVDTDGTTSYSSVKEVILQAVEGVISYYPNPLDNAASLFIEYASLKNENIDISVKDIFGRNVLYKSFSAAEGFNKFGIEVSGLAAGTYFLNVISSETSRTFKIIVN